LEYLRDYKDGPEPHETQSQHLARRGHHPTAPEEPDFAAEYLKSALQDEDGPVLFIAWRHLVQTRGIAAKRH